MAPTPRAVRRSNRSSLGRAIPVLAVLVMMPSGVACKRKDEKKVDDKNAAADAKPASRIEKIGTVAGDSTAWPVEPKREREETTSSPTLALREGKPPVEFSFDYVQLVPAEFANATEATGVTPETSTIFDFVANVHWDAYGLWLAERGGRPTVTLDALVRGDGTTIPVQGQCGDLGADRSAEPTKRAEPDFDAIHACAAIKTEGEPITALRGHIDFEFTPQREGYLLREPTAGDRVEGPVVALVVDEVDDRKVGFHLDGDNQGFWNVVGLDESGQGIRVTMISTFEGNTNVTWQTKPVALRVEFASAPQGKVPEGAACNAGGRCTRREDFNVAFAGFARGIKPADPKPNIAFEHQFPVAQEAWFDTMQEHLQNVRAVSAVQIPEGWVVLRSVQAASWLSPWLELWTPPAEGAHMQFGDVSWHVSAIGLKGGKRRAKSASAWTSPSYTSPFLYGGAFTTAVGRVDGGPVTDFVTQGSESATVVTLDGEVTFHTVDGPTATQVVPLGSPGVWSTDDKLASRLVRLSTRDVQIELRGEIDQLVAVVLRDKDGQLIDAPRIFRGGGCMMPATADSTHLCFATPRQGTASIELLTGKRKAGQKRKFDLIIE